MNKKLLILILWLAPLVGLAQSGLVLWYFDGTTQFFDVADNEKISFVADQIILPDSGSGSPVSIPVSLIRKITFGPPNVVGIPMTPSPEIPGWVYPNPVSGSFRLQSDEPGPIPFSLLSLTGQVLLSGSCFPHQDVDVSSLPAGIYLLRIKASTLKFAKK